MEKVMKDTHFNINTELGHPLSRITACILLGTGSFKF